MLTLFGEYLLWEGRLQGSSPQLSYPRRFIWRWAYSPWMSILAWHPFWPMDVRRTPLYVAARSTGWEKMSQEKIHLCPFFPTQHCPLWVTSHAVANVDKLSRNRKLGGNTGRQMAHRWPYGATPCLQTSRWVRCSPRSPHCRCSLLLSSPSESVHLTTINTK